MNKNKKATLKRNIIIGVIVAVILFFVIGMLFGDVVRYIFIGIGNGIIVISFLYLILNEPMSAIFEGFKQKTFKDKARTILGAVAIILIFILLIGGFLFLLFGLPELLKD